MKSIFILLITILLSVTSAKIQLDPYTKQNYTQIKETFEQLSLEYPTYFKLKSIDPDIFSDSKNWPTCNKPFSQSNGSASGTKCEYFYAEISDFSQQIETTSTLPQLLFTGGLQGKNSIGSNIVTYLAEYILKNRNQKKIASFLKERLLVLYPIPNPSGFLSNENEEIHSNGNKFNVEFDFPLIKTTESPTAEQEFPQKTQFQSVSSRILAEIFQRYLFVSGIGFEVSNNGGDPRIEYATLSSTQPPINSTSQADQTSIQIVSHLSKYATVNYAFSAPPYSTLPLSSPNNNFYQWATYASHKKSNSTSSTTHSDQQKEQDKTMMLRAVVSGSDVHEINYGQRESGRNSLSETKVGHIGRNIYLSLELIELSASSINAITRLNAQHSATIEWKIDGCFTVERTALFYRILSSDSDSNNNFTQIDAYKSESEIRSDFSLASEFQNKTGNLVSDEVQFYYAWNFKSQTNFEAIIIATCDPSWKRDPLDQRMIVAMKSNPEFHAENNGYSLNSTALLIYRVPRQTTIEILPCKRNKK